MEPTPLDQKHTWQFSARAAGRVLCCCTACGTLKLTEYSGSKRNVLFAPPTAPKDFTPATEPCIPPKE